MTKYITRAAAISLVVFFASLTSLKLEPIATRLNVRCIMASQLWVTHPPARL
jgi:hypothetical protein